MASSRYRRPLKTAQANWKTANQTRGPMAGGVVCFALFAFMLPWLVRCAGDRETSTGSELASCDENPPLELYEQKISPLLSDDNPKSCNQCHLTGVDLGAYVRGSPCETLACLVDDGLVDLDAPEQSKILGWIERAEPDNELITSEVIAAERDAVLQWLEASASCPSECEGAVCPPNGPEARCAVVREPVELAEADDAGCSELALEAAFERDVYAWRGRCFPCHFENQPRNEAAPRFIRTEGNCATASLETLRQIVASGYLDLSAPQRSLLLLKPLSEAGGGVAHEGDQKFAGPADPAYQSFLRFIERLSECQ